MNEQNKTYEMNETALDDITGGCGLRPIILPIRWPIQPVRPMPHTWPFPWRPVFRFQTK